jgi:transcriptional regulator with XRE-family HTH domain
MDIGSLLSSVRTRAGLTQQDLARRAGTSQSAVARLERGHGSPSVATLERLIEAAGFALQLDAVPLELQPRWKDPVIEAYKRDVDRTLLRENLGKSVDRRLRDAEAFRRDAGELRRGIQHAARDTVRDTARKSGLKSARGVERRAKRAR